MCVFTVLSLGFEKIAEHSMAMSEPGDDRIRAEGMFHTQVSV